LNKRGVIEAVQLQRLVNSHFFIYNRDVIEVDELLNDLHFFIYNRAVIEVDELLNDLHFFCFLPKWLIFAMTTCSFLLLSCIDTSTLLGELIIELYE
jgi:hypothetical protein